MAADAVRKLIDKHAPGSSLRELTAQPGCRVTEAQLRLWTNPGAQPKSLPKLDVVCGLATALGCAANEALQAFIAVVDEEALFDTATLDELTDAGERRVLAAYRRITSELDRERAIMAVEIFGGPQVCGRNPRIVDTVTRM